MSDHLGTIADAAHERHEYAEPAMCEGDLYASYTLSSNQHSIETYRQIIEEPWLDEPLRELVETRLEELLER